MNNIFLPILKATLLLPQQTPSDPPDSKDPSKTSKTKVADGFKNAPADGSSQEAESPFVWGLLKNLFQSIKEGVGPDAPSANPTSTSTAAAKPLLASDFEVHFSPILHPNQAREELEIGKPYFGVVRPPNYGLDVKQTRLSGDVVTREMDGPENAITLNRLAIDPEGPRPVVYDWVAILAKWGTVLHFDNVVMQNNAVVYGGKTRTGNWLENNPENPFEMIQVDDKYKRKGLRILTAQVPEGQDIWPYLTDPMAKANRPELLLREVSGGPIDEHHVFRADPELTKFDIWLYTPKAKPIDDGFAWLSKLVSPWEFRPLELTGSDAMGTDYTVIPHDGMSQSIVKNLKLGLFIQGSKLFNLPGIMTSRRLDFQGLNFEGIINGFLPRESSQPKKEEVLEVQREKLNKLKQALSQGHWDQARTLYQDLLEQMAIYKAIEEKEKADAAKPHHDANYYFAWPPDLAKHFDGIVGTTPFTPEAMKDPLTLAKALWSRWFLMANFKAQDTIANLDWLFPNQMQVITQSQMESTTEIINATQADFHAALGGAVSPDYYPTGLQDVPIVHVHPEPHQKSVKTSTFEELLESIGVIRTASENPPDDSPKALTVDPKDRPEGPPQIYVPLYLTRTVAADVKEGSVAINMEARDIFMDARIFAFLGDHPAVQGHSAVLNNIQMKTGIIKFHEAKSGFRVEFPQGVYIHGDSLRIGDGLGKWADKVYHMTKRRGVNRNTTVTQDEIANDRGMPMVEDIPDLRSEGLHVRAPEATFELSIEEEVDGKDGSKGKRVRKVAGRITNLQYTADISEIYSKSFSGVDGVSTKVLAQEILKESLSEHLILQIVEQTRLQGHRAEDTHVTAQITSYDPNGNRYTFDMIVDLEGTGVQIDTQGNVARFRKPEDKPQVAEATFRIGVPRHEPGSGGDPSKIVEYQGGFRVSGLDSQTELLTVTTAKGKKKLDGVGLLNGNVDFETQMTNVTDGKEILEVKVNIADSVTGIHYDRDNKVFSLDPVFGDLKAQVFDEGVLVAVINSHIETLNPEDFSVQYDWKTHTLNIEEWASRIGLNIELPEASKQYLKKVLFGHFTSKLEDFTISGFDGLLSGDTDHLTFGGKSKLSDVFTEYEVALLIPQEDGTKKRVQKRLTLNATAIESDIVNGKLVFPDGAKVKQYLEDIMMEFKPEDLQGVIEVEIESMTVKAGEMVASYQTFDEDGSSTKMASHIIPGTLTASNVRLSKLGLEGDFQSSNNELVEFFVTSHDPDDPNGSKVFKLTFHDVHARLESRKYGDEIKLPDYTGKNLEVVLGDPDERALALYVNEVMGEGIINGIHGAIAAWSNPKLTVDQKIAEMEKINGVFKIKGGPGKEYIVRYEDYTSEMPANLRVALLTQSDMGITLDGKGKESIISVHRPQGPMQIETSGFVGDYHLQGKMPLEILAWGGELTGAKEWLANNFEGELGFKFHINTKIPEQEGYNFEITDRYGQVITANLSFDGNETSVAGGKVRTMKNDRGQLMIVALNKEGEVINDVRGRPLNLLAAVMHGIQGKTDWNVTQDATLFVKSISSETKNAHIQVHVQNPNGKRWDHDSKISKARIDLTDPIVGQKGLGVDIESHVEPFQYYVHFVDPKTIETNTGKPKIKRVFKLNFASSDTKFRVRDSGNWLQFKDDDVKAITGLDLEVGNMDEYGIALHLGEGDMDGIIAGLTDTVRQMLKEDANPWDRLEGAFKVQGKDIVVHFIDKTGIEPIAVDATMDQSPGEIGIEITNDQNIIMEIETPANEMVPFRATVDAQLGKKHIQTNLEFLFTKLNGTLTITDYPTLLGDFSGVIDFNLDAEGNLKEPTQGHNLLFEDGEGNTFMVNVGFDAFKARQEGYLEIVPGEDGFLTLIMSQGNKKYDLGKDIQERLQKQTHRKVKRGVNLFFKGYVDAQEIRARVTHVQTDPKGKVTDIQDHTLRFQGSLETENGSLTARGFDGKATGQMLNFTYFLEYRDPNNPAIGERQFEIRFLEGSAQIESTQGGNRIRIPKAQVTGVVFEDKHNAGKYLGLQMDQAKIDAVINGVRDTLADWEKDSADNLKDLSGYFRVTLEDVNGDGKDFWIYMQDQTGKRPINLALAKNADDNTYQTNFDGARASFFEFEKPDPTSIHYELGLGEPGTVDYTYSQGDLSFAFDRWEHSITGLQNVITHHFGDIGISFDTSGKVEGRGIIIEDGAGNRKVIDVDLPFEALLEKGIIQVVENKWGALTWAIVDGKKILFDFLENIEENLQQRTDIKVRSAVNLKIKGFQLGTKNGRLKIASSVWDENTRSFRTESVDTAKFDGGIDIRDATIDANGMDATGHGYFKNVEYLGEWWEKNATGGYEKKSFELEFYEADANFRIENTGQVFRIEDAAVRQLDARLGNMDRSGLALHIGEGKTDVALNDLYEAVQGYRKKNYSRFQKVNGFFKLSGKNVWVRFVDRSDKGSPIDVTYEIPQTPDFDINVDGRWGHLVQIVRPDPMMGRIRGQFGNLKLSGIFRTEFKPGQWQGRLAGVQNWIEGKSDNIFFAFNVGAHVRSQDLIFEDQHGKQYPVRVDADIAAALNQGTLTLHRENNGHYELINQLGQELNPVLQGPLQQQTDSIVEPGVSLKLVGFKVGASNAQVEMRLPGANGQTQLHTLNVQESITYFDDILIDDSPQSITKTQKLDFSTEARGVSYYFVQGNFNGDQLDFDNPYTAISLEIEQVQADLSYDHKAPTVGLGLDVPGNTPAGGTFVIKRSDARNINAMFSSHTGDPHKDMDILAIMDAVQTQAEFHNIRQALSQRDKDVLRGGIRVTVINGESNKWDWPKTKDDKPIHYNIYFNMEAAHTEAWAVIPDAQLRNLINPREGIFVSTIVKHGDIPYWAKIGDAKPEENLYPANEVQGGLTSDMKVFVDVNPDFVTKIFNVNPTGDAQARPITMDAVLYSLMDEDSDRAKKYSDRFYQMGINFNEGPEVTRDKLAQFLTGSPYTQVKNPRVLGKIDAVMARSEMQKSETTGTVYDITKDPFMDQVIAPMVLGDEWAQRKFGKEVYGLLTPEEKAQGVRFVDLPFDKFMQVMNTYVAGEIKVDLHSTPTLNAVAVALFGAKIISNQTGGNEARVNVEGQKKLVNDFLPRYYQLPRDWKKIAITAVQNGFRPDGDFQTNLNILAQAKHGKPSHQLTREEGAALSKGLTVYMPLQESKGKRMATVRTDYKADPAPLMDMLLLKVSRSHGKILLNPSAQTCPMPNCAKEYKDESKLFRGSTLDLQMYFYYGDKAQDIPIDTTTSEFLPNSVSELTVRIGLDENGNPSNEAYILMRTAMMEKLKTKCREPGEPPVFVNWEKAGSIVHVTDPNVPTGKRPVKERASGFTKWFEGEPYVTDFFIHYKEGEPPRSFSNGELLHGMSAALNWLTIFGLPKFTEFKNAYVKPWNKPPWSEMFMDRIDVARMQMEQTFAPLALLGGVHMPGVAHPDVQGIISYKDHASGKKIKFEVRNGLVHNEEGKVVGGMDENLHASFEIRPGEKFAYDFSRENLKHRHEMKWEGTQRGDIKVPVSIPTRWTPSQIDVPPAPTQPVYSTAPAPRWDWDPFDKNPQVQDQPQPQYYSPPEKTQPMQVDPEPLDQPQADWNPGFPLQESTEPSGPVSHAIDGTIIYGTYKGQKLSLHDHFKGKIVLIEFWDPSIKKGKDSLPKIGGIKKDPEFSNYFETLGVIKPGSKPNEKQLTDALNQMGPNWLQILDENGQIARTWGIGQYPSFFLVDGDSGQILAAGPQLRDPNVLQETFIDAMSNKLGQNGP